MGRASVGGGLRVIWNMARTGCTLARGGMPSPSSMAVIPVTLRDLCQDETQKNNHDKSSRLFNSASIFTLAVVRKTAG